MICTGRTFVLTETSTTNPSANVPGFREWGSSHQSDFINVRDNRIMLVFTKEGGEGQDGRRKLKL